jgi:hypothetical protein
MLIPAENLRWLERSSSGIPHDFRKPQVANLPLEAEDLASSRWCKADTDFDRISTDKKSTRKSADEFTVEEQFNIISVITKRQVVPIQVEVSERPKDAAPCVP